MDASDGAASPHPNFQMSTCSAIASAVYVLDVQPMLFSEEVRGTSTSPPPITSARSSFRLIWPSSGSSGKTCLVRAHLLPVVVERFRRGAKRRGAQAATQGPGLECQAGFDLFADHSLRFCSGGLAANCQLHGAKPNNRGSFKSQ